jgi:hypothetical protein
MSLFCPIQSFKTIIFMPHNLFIWRKKNRRHYRYKQNQQADSSVVFGLMVLIITRNWDRRT